MEKANKHMDQSLFFTILAGFENLNDMICLDYNFDYPASSYNESGEEALLNKIEEDFYDKLNELEDEFGEMESLIAIQQKDIKK